MKRYLALLPLVLFFIAPQTYAAIAFVSSSSVVGVASTTVVVTSTAAGSNLFAIACFGAQPGGLPSTTSTSLTYGGTAMSYLAEVQNGAGQAWNGLYGLLNAPSGSQQVKGIFGNASFNDLVVSVFSGVNAIDTTNTTQINAVGSITPTTTVNNVNEWVSGCAGNNGGTAMTAGAGTTVRVSDHSTSGDSNATVATGTQSLVFNDGVHNYVAAIISFTPFIAAVSTPNPMSFTWIED